MFINLKFVYIYHRAYFNCNQFSSLRRFNFPVYFYFAKTTLVLLLIETWLNVSQKRSNVKQT